MTETFTPSTDITEKNTKEELAPSVVQTAEPSAYTINNILNYSKSLEINNSKLVKEIVIVKT